MSRIIFLLLVLFPLFTLADEVEINASAPSRVGVDQSFYLQYTSNTKGDLQLGDLSNFRIVGGPSIGTSQSVQIINNNYSHTTTYTHTYTLQAKTTGNFTIPPANFVVSGKTYKTNNINIEVIDQPVSQNRNSRNRRDPFANQRQQTQASQPQVSEVTAEDLYVRVHINKNEVYRGESLTATIKLYTKVDLLGFEEMVLPQFNSFWTEDIEMPQRINLEREVINGQVYNVGIISKQVLFPRHSGDLIIEPCKLTCQVRQIVRGGGRSLIDQFFGQYQNVSKTVKSPEIKIKVKPLPNSNSNDFKGAVGNYKLSTNVSKDTLIMNEALSIEVIISGNGNLRLLEKPEINFPTEFEVYDPEVKTNISANDNGVSGSKKWDFTIIPRYPGIYDLGQITFEYFDTNSKSFKTITSAPITIAVKKDEQDKDFGKTVFNYNQRSIDYISDDDIRFIHIGDLNLNNEYKPIITTWKYRLIYISLFILFMSFIILRRKQIKENSNIALVKHKKANKISQKRLKLARKYMNLDLKSDFYKEVINAIWGYLSDKLNIEKSELTRNNVEKILINRNTEKLIIDKLLNVIDKCEYAHFAPNQGETSMSTIYYEAVETINLLEQKIK